MNDAAPPGDVPPGGRSPSSPATAALQQALRAASRETSPSDNSRFTPWAPASFAEAGLSDTLVESLILKFLFSQGAGTGREVAEQLRLPFAVLEKTLRELKAGQLVAYKGSAPLNDYAYQLTPAGSMRAATFSEQCSYFGAAPVSLEDFTAGVQAQSPRRHPLRAADLRNAFADLIVNPEVFSQLGQAAHSGGAMFLFGAPGNGKTSIAERLTNAFGRYVWIPRAIGIEGEIVRLYDPTMHVEAPPLEAAALRDIDRRWIRICRPTIITGGELTLEHLELAPTGSRGVLEAPFQLKSCCGALVIDDFGRQRIGTRELLNRWIIPLEKGYDFLNLPNGKKVKVPFDQLMIFATNLEPKELVDEAFLRRIGYKIRIPDPTEQEFRELFRSAARQLEIAWSEPVVDDLIARHYAAASRPFRCCHARDLLLQIRNYCAFHEVPLEMRTEYFDAAITNYFTSL